MDRAVRVGHPQVRLGRSLVGSYGLDGRDVAAGAVLRWNRPVRPIRIHVVRPPAPPPVKEPMARTISRTTATDDTALTPSPDESTAGHPEGAPEPETEALKPGDVPPEWGHWRYTGEVPRLYAHIPVTPEPGDVVGSFWPPADDGRWEPTDDEVTRHPDNHRPEPADETSGIEQGGEG